MRAALTVFNKIGFLRENKTAFTGFVILSFFIFIATFAPFITPHDPWKHGKPFFPPSWEHLLGTNDVGQDIFSELIHSTKISLFVGFFAAFVSMVVGTLIGLISGYSRGKLDEIMMGFTDVFLLIPGLPLMIVLAAYLSPSIWNIIFVIGILWWTTTARVVRSRVLQVREMAFVETCRALGASDMYILFRHVLPNTLHVIFAKFVLTVAGAMLAEASLSFLGLGDPMQKSWGTMLHYAFSRGGFINNMWWWYLPPGICIALSVLGFVLLGYALEKQQRFLS